ncbi:MAG TPA: ATP-binding protein [Streptosporangiaceae bacterium]|nr:ATP-binding protein [Streptosporangiaceae bacterium]
MATVELAFSALPVHVRTARLIVTAVARRSGVDEALLDEVRLAVGEACSRAVEAHRLHCPDQPVRLELRDDDGRFEVVVNDTAANGKPVDKLPATPPPSAAAVGGDDPDSLGLAVISGLVDDVEIAPTRDGTQIRMGWPVSPKKSGNHGAA